MAKLPRVTAKIFALNAAEDDLGQFGSALTGAKVTSNDISVLQALPAYEEGWRAAVISNRNYPTLQESNGIQRIISQQVAYTLQMGIPEWDSGTEYTLNSFCQNSGTLYKSLIAENIGNTPGEDITKWEEISLGGAGAGTALPLGTPVLMDHVLSYEESNGYALQGTYVYSTAIAGERYGYPTFVQKMIDESKNVTNIAWTQPAAKGKTTAVFGGNMVITASSESDNNWAAQKAFDNISNSVSNGWATSGTNVTGWWQVKFPYKIKITNLRYYRRYSANADNATSGRFYTSSAKTTPIGNAFSVPAAANASYYVDIAGIPPEGIVTDTIYLATNAINGSYGGMDYLKVTAQELITKNSNGHYFYDIADKSVADTYFSSTGVADFYGIDEANQRVFMPRNNWFTQLTTDTSKVNEFVNAGLPNITGKLGGTEGGSSVTWNSGAFYNTNEWYNMAGGGQDDVLVGFDASRSSSIYGSSTTVQPKSSRKLLYYVVGNTVSDTAWVDVVTDVQGAVKDVVDEGDTQVARVEAAGNSFDNLTYRNVTNCITKIPQRIKYTLEDGNLTILAGSVCIVPYGTEDLTEEITVGSNFITDALKVVDTQFANGKFFVWAELQANKNVPKPADDWVGYAWFDVTAGAATIGFTSDSGATGTAPISRATGYFYNTTDNLIYLTTTSGLQNKTISFPFMRLTANTTAVQTINTVFNGFGFVGSVVWVDKGVEALCPNGLNSSDGTYNSIEFKNQTLALYDNANLKNTRRVLRMLADGTFARSTGFYVDQSGYLTQQDTNMQLPPSFTFAKIITDTNALITTFEPYGTFRATKVDDSISLPSITRINLTLGATGTKYVMPGNGWLYLKKQSGANNTYAYFKAPFYEVLASGATSNAYLVLFMPVTTGQTVTVDYTATGTTANFHFLYAMGGT